jgi:KDO2-lipid IV(A) lauroyltransferase
MRAVATALPIMARLILATALKQPAKRYPWLAQTSFVLEAGLVKALYWAFRALGPARASRFGRWVLSKIGPMTAKDAIIRRNLSLAFPQEDGATIARLTRGTWGSLGAVFGEYPHLARIAREPGRLEVVDECGLDRYRRDGGRTAVFVGAHVCNWEVLALALAREGVPLMVLFAPLSNPYLVELGNRARAQLGCKLLSREESMRPMIRQLISGGSLGILADLKVEEGIRVPLFGNDMVSSPVPARLALRYGCDLVPIRAERTDDARFKVTVMPALELPDPAGDEAAAVFAATRRINACIETWIGASPDQWLCTNRRWDKELYR